MPKTILEVPYLTVERIAKKWHRPFEQTRDMLMVIAAELDIELRLGVNFNLHTSYSPEAIRLFRAAFGDDWQDASREELAELMEAARAFH